MTTLYASPESVWARIIANTTISATCWTWRGAVNSRGYGSIGAGKRSRTALVHRVAVIVRDGDLADDMTVDHLCRNKLCVRPDHLDVVTGAENTRRGLAARGYHIGGKCSAGHLLTDETVYHSPRGRLVCRLCARARSYANRPIATRIREWAAENGHQIASTGRLSAAVTAAYEAAHPTKEAS